MITPRKELFAKEYLIDLNATRAAERSGYSPKTAYSQGQRLLKDVDVQRLIQEAQAERAKRVELDADTVLQNIIEIGQRCMQRYPVMRGTGKERKQVKELVQDPETGQEVLADVWSFDSQGALRAQELLGKHLKLFTDKAEVSGPDGEPITLNIHPIKPAPDEKSIESTPEVRIVPRETPGAR